VEYIEIFTVVAEENFIGIGSISVMYHEEPLESKYCP
jgi:hypothetical protein